MAMNSSELLFNAALDGDRRALAKLLTIAEEGGPVHAYDRKPSWILGITGPPGAGKSTLIDRLASSWSEKGETIAILAVDPSSPVSGGALLGDRARMVFQTPPRYTSDRFPREAVLEESPTEFGEWSRCFRVSDGIESS